MSSDETFFTTVGCMDGRIQDPVSDFGRKKFSAEFADTITEAGLVGLLSTNPAQTLLDSIKNKLDISIEKHHSKGILVHGHQNCAGNPVPDEKHIEDVRKSVDEIRSLIKNKITVVGVFVKQSSSDPKVWEVQDV